MQQPGDSIEPNTPAPQDEVEVKPTTQEAQWEFKNETDEPISSDERTYKDIEPVSWTASEYVAQHKTPMWFVGLGLVTAIACILVFAISREILSTIIVGVMGMAFGVFAARSPEVLPYTVNEHGVQIGKKLYPYETIKSFSIIQDGAFRSIMLMPLKRFMPPISMYFSPDDEEKIINTLGSYLPHEVREHDIVDKLMRKIRF